MLYTLRQTLIIGPHTGAGAENGAERARKPDERESGVGAGLEKIRWSGNGAGTEREREVAGERERSGERAESAAHNPLKPNN